MTCASGCAASASGMKRSPLRWHADTGCAPGVLPAGGGWTLGHAAERFNALAAQEGTDPQVLVGMTGSHLCEHERWPDGGAGPR